MPVVTSPSGFRYDTAKLRGDSRKDEEEYRDLETIMRVMAPSTPVLPTDPAGFTPRMREMRARATGEGFEPTLADFCPFNPDLEPPEAFAAWRSEHTRAEFGDDYDEDTPAHPGLVMMAGTERLLTGDEYKADRALGRFVKERLGGARVQRLGPPNGEALEARGMIRQDCPHNCARYVESEREAAAAAGVALRIVKGFKLWCYRGLGPDHGLIAQVHFVVARAAAADGREFFVDVTPPDAGDEGQPVLFVPSETALYPGVDAARIARLPVDEKLQVRLGYVSGGDARRVHLAANPTAGLLGGRHARDLVLWVTGDTADHPWVAVAPLEDIDVFPEHGKFLAPLGTLDAARPPSARA